MVNHADAHAVEVIRVAGCRPVAALDHRRGLARDIRAEQHQVLAGGRRIRIACVADAILIEIGLIRVGPARAVVERIDDAVAVFVMREARAAIDRPCVA